MDKRTEIALWYVNSKDWIGGTYYVENLVCALNTLDDGEKPNINLYCDSRDNYEHFKNVTGYPHVTYYNYVSRKPLIYRLINGFRFSLNPLTYKALGSIDLRGTNNKVIFPTRFRTLAQPEDKQLAWIPDFQEKYYPQFFNKKQLKIRESVHKSFILNKIPIVFSSRDSEDTFYKFYPEAKGNIKTYVLHFAVTHPKFDDNIDELRRKYKIDGDYLFCANQFWVHKNHKLLFEAFAEVKKRGSSLKLVCTGNMYDHRFKDYSHELASIIDTNRLSDDVKLVGFISREEQLCLMSHSYAIVQPSLFEGWSTVVEDAKALNKFIFLSNINVHKEQSPKNVCYFTATNKDDLVDKIINTEITSEEYGYGKDVIEYARHFMEIVNKF